MLIYYYFCLIINRLLVTSKIFNNRIFVGTKNGLHNRSLKMLIKIACSIQYRKKISRHSTNWRHSCPPFQHLLSEGLTSLGIMGAPRVPPLNPPETIVLSEHYRLWGVSGGHPRFPHYAERRSLSDSKCWNGGKKWVKPPWCREASVSRMGVEIADVTRRFSIAIFFFWRFFFLSWRNAAIIFSFHQLQIKNIFIFLEPFFWQVQIFPECHMQ